MAAEVRPDKAPVAKSGKRVFGPCGECAFYMANETRPTHQTGRCHGAPPTPMGFPIVKAIESGCAVFQPR